MLRRDEELEGVRFKAVVEQFVVRAVVSVFKGLLLLTADGEDFAQALGPVSVRGERHDP